METRKVVLRKGPIQMQLPENLLSLHLQEEQLRSKAIEFIAEDTNLQLHFSVVERAMDIRRASLSMLPSAHEFLWSLHLPVGTYDRATSLQETLQV